MTVDQDYRKIGILGHYGNGNLGDEAIIAAVIQSVRRHLPNAVPIGFSINPEDTNTRHKIEAFPIRRWTPKASKAGNAKTPPLPTDTKTSAGSGGLRSFIKSIPVLYPLLKALYRAPSAIRNGFSELAFLNQSRQRLKDIDLLVIAGSGQLYDEYGGPWAFPYTLYKWSKLAKMTGTKLAFCSVGAGPVLAPMSWRMIRRALAMADYRSFRDHVSVELVEKHGVRGHNPEMPDLACSLEYDSYAVPEKKKDGRLTIGINPVPFYDYRYWQYADPHKYGAYVTKLAEFGCWLLDNGHNVLLFYTKLPNDAYVVDDIKEIMYKDRGGQSISGLIEKEIESLEDVMASIHECDLILASRFHGVLIPSVMAKPVIGLAYHPKTWDMMAYLGQPQNCLDIEKCTTEELIEKFEHLKVNRQKVSEELAVQSKKLRDDLEAQYRTVYTL